MPSASTKKLSSELASMAGERALLGSPRGQQALRDALASRDASLIGEAARIVTQQLPSGLEPALRDSYRALVGERAGTLDPGCLAKEAVLTALDALEDSDAELFAEAAQYVQEERAKGGARDTAARVRARGVLGLARLGHADLLPILGACLGDRDATVRLSAARALGHRAQRDGAGLLLLRAKLGDEVPEVVVECVRGLFASAPEFALRHARAALRSADATQREHVLQALGTAPSDAAVALLGEELAAQTLSDARQRVIEALGLSLRPSARTLLVELVAGERSSDAEAALEALAIHRYDERLVAQLEALSADSPGLARRFAALFAR